MTKDSGIRAKGRRGTLTDLGGDGAGTPQALAWSRGESVPRCPDSDDPEPAPTYHLELRVRPAKGDRAWDASLEGTTPEGRTLERRDFESLIDLMRFLEALIHARGLR